MNKPQFLHFFCFFCTLFLPLEARAAEPGNEPSVVVQVMSAVTYPVSLTPMALMPPSLAQGVNISFPVKNGWSFSGEIDLTTGFGLFQPGVQALAGSSKKLGKSFALGGTAFYRVTPSLEEGTLATHSMGLSVVPIVPLAFGSLSFPTGVSVNLSTGATTAALNFKLGLRMP